MKLSFHPTEGKVQELKLPFPEADAAVVQPPAPCPHCGAEEMKVQGTGKHIESQDTYASNAITTCCSKHVGTIRAKVNTLFGIEEDERVFSMGVRIY